jgi:hypothetical protein
VTTELRNCRVCGTLFVGAPGLCPACRAAEDAAFDRVRRYVEEHGGAALGDICAATGVSADQVRRFLQEGRLVLEGAGLVCERCGAPIATGRFCLACVGELRRAGQSAASPRAPVGGIYSRSERGQRRRPEAR